VLGIFLGGLSLGYSLFGSVTSRLVTQAQQRGTTPRLLLTYGVIEAAIGFYALAFPWLFRAAQSISFALPHTHAGIGFSFDVILSAVLIGPPAVLMGATIPILTQALSRSLDDATRFHAFVYGLNTVGAFAGALAAGFFVIPRLGLDGTLFAMGAINLLAGAGYAILGLRGQRQPLLPVAPEPETAKAADVTGVWIYLTVALLIGFAMMTLETTLIRLAGLSFGSSHFTFSMVVSAFVLCIAIGGLTVSGLSRVPKIYLAINLWALVALLAGLYFLLPQAPYWVLLLRLNFISIDAAFYLYYLAGFALLVLVIGLPVVLSGITLPLIFHHLRDEVGELGSLAGQLYSWNTVGSLLGALIGGYVLFFWFDLHHVYRFALAAVMVSAVLMTVQLFKLRSVVIAIVVPLLLTLTFMPPWYSMILQMGLFRTETEPPNLRNGYYEFVEKHIVPLEHFLLSYEDDPTATVSVLNIDLPGQAASRTINVNGKTDGNTKGDYVTMALVAVLPALMADRIDRAFVIGWGTGITVGELASLDGTKEIIAAEISSGVIKAAKHFEQFNMRASSNPKVNLIRSDAYRELTRSEANFNLIISEPSNPWVTSVEMLYSREFLQLARDRLAPGGVYAQWYHEYDADDESLQLVLRTFGSVFEHVSVWVAGDSDLIIMGFPDIGPAIDYHRLIERAKRPDYRASFKRMGFDGLVALLANEHLPVGVWHAGKFEGPIHTLYHPLLSDLAGRAFFRHDSAVLPFTGFGEAAKVGHKNAVLRRYTELKGGTLGDEERLAAVNQACHSSRGFGVTMVAAWANESPSSPAFDKAHRLALDWIQRYKPEVRQPATLIRNLSTLFEPYPGVAQRITPAILARRTTLYSEFYYHAVPFDPSRLMSAVSRCREISKTRNQCMQEIRSGSQKSMQIIQQGKAAIEAFLTECTAMTYEGPLCKLGTAKVQELLSGGSTGHDAKAGAVR
jgi:predicted membrane-bound spermidine synthase